MKLVKTQEEAMLENAIKRSCSTGERGNSTEGWWRQYRKLHPSGRSKVFHTFSGMMEKWSKDLHVDGCFLGANHFSEESLGGMNDSMKTKSLPWLSGGLQRNSHMGKHSTGSVLASEQWQESTWILLRPSKFKSVRFNRGAEPGPVPTFFGGAAISCLLAKISLLRKQVFLFNTRKHHFPLTHMYFFKRKWTQMIELRTIWRWRDSAVQRAGTERV